MLTKHKTRYTICMAKQTIKLKGNTVDIVRAAYLLQDFGFIDLAAAMRRDDESCCEHTPKTSRLAWPNATDLKKAAKVLTREAADTLHPGVAKSFRTVAAMFNGVTA